jgi:hypothetical protein
MRLSLIFLLLFPFAAFCEDGDKVSIQPNTSSDKITIEIEEQVHASMVQILTEDGTVLWTEHRKEQEFKLNLEFYPPGTYTIQISIFDQVKRQKFVKR